MSILFPLWKKRTKKRNCSKQLLSIMIYGSLVNLIYNWIGWLWLCLTPVSQGWEHVQTVSLTPGAYRKRPQCAQCCTERKLFCKTYSANGTYPSAVKYYWDPEMTSFMTALPLWLTHKQPVIKNKNKPLVKLIQQLATPCYATQKQPKAPPFGKNLPQITHKS